MPWCGRGGRPRILFVGSGLVYGNAETADAVQNEDSPLRPNNPYAASKAAADLASYQYSCHPGLDIVRARPFNHIGPRQSPQYAIAHFAKQLAAAQRGPAPLVLETGDLSPCRDLTDVRDVIAAYLALMEKGRKGEAYNIASGQTVSMREVLDRLIALSGVAVEVRQRGDLLRATELTVAKVDTSKLRRETGWAPRYSLDETLAETLAFWLEARDHRLAASFCERVRNRSQKLAAKQSPQQPLNHLLRRHLLRRPLPVLDLPRRGVNRLHPVSRAGAVMVRHVQLGRCRDRGQRVQPAVLQSARQHHLVVDRAHLFEADALPSAAVRRPRRRRGDGQAVPMGRLSRSR